MADFLDPLLSPARLERVEQALRNRFSAGSEYDRITELASLVLNVPTCLISLVNSERQEFMGACGLPEELAEIRGTPLSHSICRLSVITREAVIVDDAAADPRTADNPVIGAIGLGAYLGFPLISDSGQVLGAFCMIDYGLREWSKREIDAVRQFAALAVWQIEAVGKIEKTRAALDLAVHDLRSPLSEIVMASSMIEEQISPHLRPLVGMVKSSSDSAIQLLKDLSETDKNLTCRICADPVATISLVCDRLNKDASAKGITLNLESHGSCRLDTPPWVLEHVFENLATNAIKYGPKNSAVWVSFYVTPEFGHIRIRDEGPGFSPADMKRLFERYVKLSASPTGNEISTGLGLSIAKRLANQHGGRLELISQPRESAEFEVTFGVV